MNSRPRPMFLFLFTSFALIFTASSAFACGGYGAPHQHGPNGVREMTVQQVHHAKVLRPRIRTAGVQTVVVNRGPNHEHIHTHTIGHPAGGNAGVVVQARPGWRRNKLRGHAWLIKKQQRKIQRLQADLAQMQAEIAVRDRRLARRDRQIRNRDRQLRDLNRRVSMRRHHQRRGMKRRAMQRRAMQRRDMQRRGMTGRVAYLGGTRATIR